MVLFGPAGITLIVLAVTMVFFIWGKIRSDLVALCGLLALALTGILTPEESLSGFSSSITIMMIGLFVVGSAIFRTGLAKMVGSKIISLAGDSEARLFVLIMLVTACVGAFVSNTGTVAMMMPIVISITASAGINPKRYLMPLAFGSSMGLFTLISTSPNLVIQDVIVKNGFKPLSFFSFAPVGAICLGVGVIGLYFLSKLLVRGDDGENVKKNKGVSLLEMAERYRLKNRSFRLAVAHDSPLVGKTLAELKISTLYNVNINKVARKSSSRFSRKLLEVLAGPSTMIGTEDVLFCQGMDADINGFAEKNKLTIIKEHDKEAFARFYDFGIAEVYILPSSKLNKRTVAETRFRETYNVNILAIQRGGEVLEEDLKDVILKVGDGLLVQGKWSDLAKLEEEQRDLVVVGQPLQEAAKVTLDTKAPLAAFIMVSMIVMLVINVIPTVITVLTAASLMVLTGCLRNMEDAYSGINWQSVLLIAAMMPMAIAFEKTGLTSMIASLLVDNLGDMGKYALLAGIYLCTSLMTMVISNTATAILFAPIAMQAAVGVGASPYPFMFAVTVGASMCFASPFSTPPNAIVMAAGRYSFMDYIKVGLPLQVLIAVVMIMALPFIYPF